MSISTPQDWLGGGKGPAAYFKRGDQFGKELVGKIVKVETQQERTYGKDAKPKFYEDGNPVEQLVITLQTTHRDPADPKDTGLRRTFLKNRLKPALRQAIEDGGAEGFEIGGLFKQTYTGETPNEDVTLNPSRDYTFKYTSVANLSVMGGNATPAAAPAPAPEPAPPAATPPADNAAKAQALLAGLSADERAMLGLPPQ